ncbi:histidine kinase [Paenibacillus sp. N1-5-1-14]|uniref:histidine kinase n=1 Tax=Paenibacillus radicibacter TaxID=2972488 RepID=UPI002158D93E|nr:histidine kinase [Paenibacillus radicibacter]MCR8643608.1 histidine kinase [Paenibacillus radicibacter]
MSRLYKDKFIVGLFLLTLLAGLAMWYAARLDPSLPRVNKGILDLSQWQPTKDPILPLDGEWEFYPRQLLTTGYGQPSAKEGQWIEVPGSWNNWKDAQGLVMDGRDYGTYRLLIKNAPLDQMLSISKNYVRFADKLVVDGITMGESGHVAESREDYEPRNVPYTVYFHTDSKQIEILLQTSNYDYWMGGITNSLFLGLSGQMAMKKNIQTALEFTAVTILMLFSLLHVGLYLFFHRNRLLLMFGLFFLLCALTIFTNGERLILQLFPWISFEVAFKIKNISQYMMPGLLFYISGKLIPLKWVRRILIWAAGGLSIYSVGVLILPFQLYSAGIDGVYFGLTGVYAVLMVSLLICYLTGRYGPLNRLRFQLFIVASWSLLITGVIVILNSQNVISLLLTNITVFIFIICSAMLLIHEYIEAYVSMRKLTKQLQMADAMKDEFLLITSHELKTPLHGIINLSQSLLAEPIRKSSLSEQKDRLQLIRNTAYRMSNMVNDIIDAAKMKDGNLVLENKRVDLVSCMSIALEVFEFLAKGRNTRLSLQINSEARYVLADENRFMQVLYNVINHRLSLIHEGVVTITSMSDRSMTRILISYPIVDQENEKRDNGFALGLSIARELIELMGGRLSLGQVDECMEIILPSAGEDESLEIAASLHMDDEMKLLEGSLGKPFKEKRSKILIASADPINIEHLYSLLVMEGFDVIGASTDEEAYAQITRRDRPDLIFIDVLLPGANGYELCRRIRQHFTQAEMPILMIPARSTPADIEAGIAAGASDFINRPLDAGEIRVRIHTMLSMKRLVKEASVNEMAFLRSQIKPHFLYNALGTIMSLCYTDGTRAGELLSTFSRYLRIIFHMDNTEETVTLSKEMELIQAYVDIEKERFGDRVRIEMDVDQELYNCHVMPLTIEPLVENAIRHGVSKKISGGTVRLTIHRQGEFVEVTVNDDGVGMSQEQINGILTSSLQGQGVGFRNIMRRVAHLTGKEPIVESEQGVGTRVTIWLPLTYS